MNVPRFVVARAAGDTIILHDNIKKRLALIVPRDVSLGEEKAEAAALAMAEVCAEALNRVHAARTKKEA